jgi:hypothetical protein
MQRFAIACILLFFCGSLSMADNFTPIINRPPQAVQSTAERKARGGGKVFVHGFAPTSNLHLGYTLPSLSSCLRRIVRLRALASSRCPAWVANQNHQKVMIVTDVASDREYFCAKTICFQWREA